MIEDFNRPMFDLAKLKEMGGFKAGDLIAVDPKLFEKFIAHTGQRVKRDLTTRNLVFLTGVSAYTREPLNLFLRGESSIGKTYVVVQVLSYFPKEDVWLLGGLSPTALVYDRGVLVDRNGEVILPSDKPSEDAPKEDKEDYRERMKGAHYLVDLSGKILVFLEAPNIETFNRLRPILSHDAPEIIYKSTETRKGQLQSIHVVVRGWPSTIFCTTSDRFVQDLATRSLTNTPETTPEKYRDANFLTGNKASFPWAFERDLDFNLLEGYIRTLRNRLPKLRTVIPFAEELAIKFPSKFPRSMRDFAHLLGLIEVSALFHFAQRPTLVRKSKTEVSMKGTGTPLRAEEIECYVLAVKSDYDRVMALWKAIQETTETSAASHIMTFFHEVVEEVAKENETFSISELTDRWNKKFETRKSSDTIRKWVDFLCDIGYVTKEPDPVDKRQNRLKVIRTEKSRNYTQNDSSVFFTLDSFKKWLNKAEQLLEENQILLIENLVSEKETTPETIFAQYYDTQNSEPGKDSSVNPLHRTDSSSSINLNSSCISSDESAKKRTENDERVHLPSLKVEDILKLERLTGNFRERCVVCGFSDRMDWQVTLHDQSWGLLCSSCGLKLEKLIEGS